MDEREITPLLQRAHEGDAEAMNEVARRVYADLTRLAGSKLHGKFAGKPTTLAPQDIANETFIKLLKQRNKFKDREHFFALATKIMMRVLADYEKARAREKRGGNDKIMVTLGALDSKGKEDHVATAHDVTAALDRLEEHDVRLAKVFRLREIWGLSSREVADMLNVGKSTVERDWRFARAWLRNDLEDRQGE